MCRSIRTLHNFIPPATEEEMRAAALQYVRKVAGFTRPSQANAAAFDEAVEAVAGATRRLVDRLVTSAPPKTREAEQARARERWQRRLRRRQIPRDRPTGVPRDDTKRGRTDGRPGDNPADSGFFAKGASHEGVHSFPPERAADHPRH